MSDPQLLLLREEYLRLQMHRSEVENDIRMLESRLPLLSRCLASLERGERPSDDALETLNIKSRSNLALLYKTVGLRKQTETLLTDRKAELQNIMSKLASVLVCPRCSGIGTTPMPTRYERMQEGMIIPVSSASRCDLCQGSGKLALFG